MREKSTLQARYSQPRQTNRLAPREAARPLRNGVSNGTQRPNLWICVFYAYTSELFSFCREDHFRPDHLLLCGHQWQLPQILGGGALEHAKQPGDGKNKEFGRVRPANRWARSSAASTSPVPFGVCVKLSCGNTTCQASSRSTSKVPIHPSGNAGAPRPLTITWRGPRACRRRAAEIASSMLETLDLGKQFQFEAVRRHHVGGGHSPLLEERGNSGSDVDARPFVAHHRIAAINYRWIGGTGQGNGLEQGGSVGRFAKIAREDRIALRQ